MIRNYRRKVRHTIKRFFLTVVREWRETKSMVQIYLHKRHDEELLRLANRQLVDIFKILLLFPISILPGSVVVVTVLELIAKFFGGTIFPKKTMPKEPTD